MTCLKLQVMLSRFLIQDPVDSYNIYGKRIVVVNVIFWEKDFCTIIFGDQLFLHLIQQNMSFLYLSQLASYLWK